MDWDAETLELWPASVMAETACGSLVNSSFTMVPVPMPWRMVEDGLAVVGASPFTATTRSPTWFRVRVRVRVTVTVTVRVRVRVRVRVTDRVTVTVTVTVRVRVRVRAVSYTHLTLPTSCCV